MNQINKIGEIPFVKKSQAGNRSALFYYNRLIYRKMMIRSDF